MADEKKHKSGFALLKEKLEKAEAENKELRAAVEKSQTAYLELTRTSNEYLKKVRNARDEWKKDAEAKQTTIEQQSRKISQLTADLKVAQDNLKATDREHERQLKEMYDHMGWFKRMTWDWHHAPTFKEDERWNETH